MSKWRLRPVEGLVKEVSMKLQRWGGPSYEKKQAGHSGHLDFVVWATWTKAGLTTQIIFPHTTMTLWSKSVLSFHPVPNVLEFAVWLYRTLVWHKVSIGVRNIGNCSSLQINSLLLGSHNPYLSPSFLPSLIFFLPSHPFPLPSSLPLFLAFPRTWFQECRDNERG